MISIEAILAVRNAAPTLDAVLQHLLTEGIHAVAIDNGSTDKTREILESHRAHVITDIIDLPFDGVFRLTEQLILKQQIAEQSSADWLLHLDGDEIIESPRNGESLRSFVQRCHEEGAQVIDCDEFVFCPAQNEGAAKPESFVSSLRNYYFFSPPGRKLRRFIRRDTPDQNWAWAGGHNLCANEVKVAPEHARMRHYIGLSLEHLQAQYLSRVFDAEELRSGKHWKRVASDPDFVRLPKSTDMRNLDQDGWKIDEKHSRHPIFKVVERYQPPEVIPAVVNLRPMPFVVGVGRSGTTLLRLMLDAHPDLAMTPETHWLRGLIHSIKQSPDDRECWVHAILTTPSWVDMRITKDELTSIVYSLRVADSGSVSRAIYDHYRERFGKSRAGDKTPMHGLYMTAIAAALPEARFIHIIRDGRDVALSYRDLWFGPGKDARKAATMWMWRIREMRQQAQFLPHYLEVHYEELLRDPEPTLRKIADFIDLPFDTQQLNYHQSASRRLEELQDVTRPEMKIPAEARRGIHRLTSSMPDTSRIERWKKEMSPEEITLFARIAGDFLADLGYERV